MWSADWQELTLLLTKLDRRQAVTWQMASGVSILRTAGQAAAKTTRSGSSVNVKHQVSRFFVILPVQQLCKNWNNCAAYALTDMYTISWAIAVFILLQSRFFINPCLHWREITHWPVRWSQLCEDCSIASYMPYVHTRDISQYINGYPEVYSIIQLIMKAISECFSSDGVSVFFLQPLSRHLLELSPLSSWITQHLLKL